MSLSFLCRPFFCPCLFVVFSISLDISVFLFTERDNLLTTAPPQSPLQQGGRDLERRAGAPQVRGGLLRRLRARSLGEQHRGVVLPPDRDGKDGIELRRQLVSWRWCYSLESSSCLASLARVRACMWLSLRCGRGGFAELCGKERRGEVRISPCCLLASGQPGGS